MSEVSRKVAEMLLSTESIAVYKDKPFVFVSGRISPVYIDCRKLLSFAAEREYIVTALAKKAETDIGLDKIDVVAGGETNRDAAWYYPETKTDAKNIEGYIAFWKGVQVTE